MWTSAGQEKRNWKKSTTKNTGRLKASACRECATYKWTETSDVSHNIDRELESELRREKHLHSFSGTRSHEYDNDKADGSRASIKKRRNHKKTRGRVRIELIYQGKKAFYDCERFICIVSPLPSVRHGSELIGAKLIDMRKHLNRGMTKFLFVWTGGNPFLETFHFFYAVELWQGSIIDIEKVLQSSTVTSLLQPQHCAHLGTQTTTPTRATTVIVIGSNKQHYHMDAVQNWAESNIRSNGRKIIANGAWI